MTHLGSQSFTQRAANWKLSIWGLMGLVGKCKAIGGGVQVEKIITMKEVCCILSPRYFAWSIALLLERRPQGPSFPLGDLGR